jgi:hypothetical protein
MLNRFLNLPFKLNVFFKTKPRYIYIFRLADFGVKKFAQCVGKSTLTKFLVLETSRINSLFQKLKSLPLRGMCLDFSQKMHSGGAFWLLF